jgi:hypothetical protein
MARTLYYHNLMILTWRKPYESLKFFYPNVSNLLVIGNWSFSPAMPSEARLEKTKKGWADTFSEIVEFDNMDEDLIEKVVRTIRFSTKDWILLCTDEYKTNIKIAEILGIHLVSGSRALIEEPEEVY